MFEDNRIFSEGYLADFIKETTLLVGREERI
jgi:hypothetical protein